MIIESCGVLWRFGGGTAVEVLPKISDHEELAAKNQWRVQRLLDGGHAFRNVLEMHFYWCREIFRFSKSRSCVISLAD